ncbi:hypothetical protein FRC07_005048 [Ceratobasidium sp. 392]|nr:hypothetical protein FRC07_005048 [Ceratobasidium sp. 392]
MPAVRIDGNPVFVKLKSIICAVSLFHNCAKYQCLTAQTKVIMQERQETALRGHQVQHQGNLIDTILNMASLQSAESLQLLRSPPKILGSTQDVARTAVADWEAEQERSKTEKDQATMEKEVKKMEREHKKAERGKRKADNSIYAATVGPRSLNLVARKIALAFLNEIGEGPLPTYYRAQIAQLPGPSDESAFDLIRAAPAPPTDGKRTKSDSGFWTAIDAKYKELVWANGTDYKNNNRWRQWETKVINQDLARYDGQTQHFAPEVVQDHAPGIYPHVATSSH